LDDEGMPTGEPFSRLKGTDTDRMGTSEIFGSSLGARSAPGVSRGLIRYALFDELVDMGRFYDEDNAGDLASEFSGGFRVPLAEVGRGNHDACIYDRLGGDGGRAWREWEAIRSASGGWGEHGKGKGWWHLVLPVAWGQRGRRHGHWWEKGRERFWLAISV